MERLVMSGEKPSYSKSSASCLSNRGFRTPQVYSPIPIRSPVVMTAKEKITSFPIKDLFDAFDQPDSPPRKVNKSLLNKFQELTNDGVIDTRYRFESRLIDSKVTFGYRPTRSERQKLFEDMTEEDFASLTNMRVPSRVSNPHILNEEFERDEMSNFEKILQANDSSSMGRLTEQNA